MTTTSAPIELRRSRGFGDQINVTFAFIRENYRSLGKSILYICGPPVLLAGILIGGNWVSMLFEIRDLESLGNNFTIGSAVGLVVGILCGLLSSLLMIGVVNSYVFLYLERGRDGFEVDDVWQATRASLGKVFTTMIALWLAVIVFYVLWVVMIVVGSVFGALLGLVILPVLLYFGVRLTPLFTVRLYEQVGFGEAISRSMELVQGHWWLTVGVLFLVSMISSFGSYIFLIPAYILMGVAALSSGHAEDFGDFGQFSVVITALLVLAMITSYLLYALPTLATVLHYFNLVEKHEGVGMMEKIDQIGQEEDPSDLGTHSF